MLFSWLTATLFLNTSVQRLPNQKNNKLMIHSNLIILDILVKFKTWRNVSQNAATSNIAIWLWCRTADRTAMVWHVSARTFAKCCLPTRPELVSTSHMFLDNRSGKIHEERSAHLAVYFKDFTVTNKRFKRRFFLVFRQLWEKIYEGYWPLKYRELKALECGELHKKRKTVVIFASGRNIILVIEQIIASMYVISWINLETAYHKWQHDNHFGSEKVVFGNSLNFKWKLSQSLFTKDRLTNWSV